MKILQLFLPLTFLILITGNVGVFGAKIMFFLGVSSYSHRISMWPLAESLASRNHSITFVSPFPAKKPNPKITDYVPTSLSKMMEDMKEEENSGFFKDRITGATEWKWFTLGDWGINLCNILMEDKGFVKYVKENKFDLVVIDSLANECAYGWAHLHKSKVIIFNTANPLPWYTESIGFPDEGSWLPDQIFHTRINSPSMIDRAINMFTPLYYNYLRTFNFFPELEKIIRKNLNPDFPSASDYERNVSLLMANYHFAEDFSRPLPPNVIPVGGMECAERLEELPKEMKEFLKDDEFIYMSFGSYAEIASYPEETQKVIVNSLKKLKLKVIWKSNVEKTKDFPKNIYTAEWMPQQAILAHPKIRAFITHAGLLGIHEAICNSVPLIAFPQFAEQDYNADKLVWRKVGIKLEITTITEQKFIVAVQRVLEDKSYALNMKDLSKRFRDRPARPVDTAVWWTEYILRHDFTEKNSLRPLSIYQSWWKKRQLDIWFCVFLLLLLLLKVFYTLFKFVVKLCLGSKKDGGKKVKKN